MVSADTFMSVTCSQGQLGGPANTGIICLMPVGLRSAASEHRANYRTLGLQGIFMKSVSNCLVRHIHTSGLL